MGAALGVVSGGGYTLAAAAVDAASGAACVGALSKGAKLLRAIGSSRRLRTALTVAGNVARHGDEAHHVVAAGARGAREARAILRYFAIDIDDATNGVFLPREFHRRMHTAEYYKRVTDLLSNANSREEAVEILKKLAREVGEKAAQ